MQFTNFYRTQ